MIPRSPKTKEYGQASLVTVMTIFLTYSSQLFAAQKNFVITSDVWCPFNCAMGNADQGFMIDVAREILGTQGYKVEYQTQSWSDSRTAVANGKKDAVVGASREEAIGLVLAEEPLGENKNCFYTGIDDPFIFQGVAGLVKRRIAVSAGYLYGSSIDRYVEDHRANFDLVQLGTGDQPLLQNIRKLKAKRLDTLIENQHVMDYSLRKYRISGIRLAGCEAPTPLYMAISPKRDDAGKISSLMARGIRRLRQSGRMREILLRYGLEDWK